MGGLFRFCVFCRDCVLIDSKWLFLYSCDVISHSYMPGCYRVTVNLVVPLTVLAALNASYKRALWGVGGCWNIWWLSEQNYGSNGIAASLDVWFSCGALNCSSMKHTHAWIPL